MNISHAIIGLPIVVGTLFLSGCQAPPDSNTDNNKDKVSSFPRKYQPVFDFGSITPEAIDQAAENAVKTADRHLENLLKVSDHSFDNTMREYDRIHHSINRVLHPMELVIEAFPDEAVRKAGEEADKKLKNYRFELEINEEVYKIIQEYAKTEEAGNLTGFKKKFLDDQLLKYKQNGMALSAEDREKIKTLKGHIERLGTKFRTNIGASGLFLEITPADTAGMDPQFLEARKTEQGTYKLDMSYPTRSGVLAYAKEAKVRKHYMQKFYNRGMPKNTETLDSILYYRHQLAGMLGYDNYAQYQVAMRMAKSTETVWEFENSLIANLQEKAKFDYEQLLEVARQQSEDSVIHEWDVSYLLNRLKTTEYDLDDKALSEYFELNRVMDGLFQITQTMFGLRYVEVDSAAASVWHPEVRQFYCLDAETGDTIGVFYLDLFPREHKYSHAAMFTIHGGVLSETGEYLIPEAALVCNFPRSEGDKPALLRHGNARTFFHEFGHLIHGMLTAAEISVQAGLEDVTRDFVEAPSQLYENWVYEKEALSLFARHYKTGEVIPDEMLDKIIRVKNLYSGLGALRQCFYGSYDFTLHNKYVPYQGESTSDVARKMRKDIMWFDVMEDTRFEASFGHLIGYSAGYYGYMWSKVYAQDMWSVFEEKGVLNPEVGKAYRKKVLEPAASLDPMSLVENFLGRKPNNKALLRELGVEEVP